MHPGDPRVSAPAAGPVTGHLAHNYHPLPVRLVDGRGA